MTAYHAPTRDMRFVIEAVAGLDSVADLEAFREQEITAELVAAVLEEAAKLANEVFAPLNRTGDLEPARLGNDGVITTPGFADAYRRFVEGGWNSLNGPVDFGGQGLPELISVAAHEMWNSANLSLALCPLLTAGAIEALKHHGSPAQQQHYLPKLVSGEWTGTMNLTEPQAGSDLSAVRTRAVPEGDHYRLYGQKIYITWGDHDAADNVIHLVLARTPDAPEGVKGISLFLVPKRLVNEDGRLGARNDVHCHSLEHKLGIHGSPTCVMQYGDNVGAIGYLVGEENHGLAHMFTMMNEARLKVGLQGLAIGERAYQQARDYALNRIQGRRVGDRTGERVAIAQHADVRRMLLTMKALNQAMRGLCYSAAREMDLARHHSDAAERERHQRRLDLLIPVVKGWCTELGIEIASLGVQVHGGMGFIEETGAAQHYRDARILTIYEGTTGIQANDLVGRKLGRDRGAAMQALIDDLRADEQRLAAVDDPELEVIRRALAEGRDALTEATDWMLQQLGDDHPAECLEVALGQAVNYLMLTGYVCGSWQMARAALVAYEKRAAGDDPVFYQARLATARFYAEQLAPRAAALLRMVLQGNEQLMRLDDDQL